MWSASSCAFDRASHAEIGGWRDYTRDVLAISQDDPAAGGRHVATPTALTTNYNAHNGLLDHAHIAHRRTFIFNSVAAPNRPRRTSSPSTTACSRTAASTSRRSGRVEEWTLLNYPSLHHPFHVHTQDAEVMSGVSPLSPCYRNPSDLYWSVQYVTDMSQPAPAQWTQDIVNVPPAEVDESTAIDCRTRTAQMSLVRAIPHDPVYAVTSSSPAGPEVTVYRSSDNTLVRTIVPFGRRPASLATAIGTVDGDAIPDLAVASGAGMQTTARIYSGASKFAVVIADLHPFATATTGASVALGDLNGDGRDDIVAGAGAGGPPRVAIFDGQTHLRLAGFDAYASRGGVSVATGIIEEGGRTSLVTGTGSGPGGPPTVVVYNFDLFGNDEGVFPDVRRHLDPQRVVDFNGADAGQTGGVDVATANPYAASGGFSNVEVTPRSGHANVRIFTIHQAGMEGQIDVAASGVMRPHDYEPLAKRMAMPVDQLAGLRPHLPAAVSALSGLTGAQLLTIPRAGGRVSLWSAVRDLATSRYTWHARTVAAHGTGVSGN